MADTQGGVEFLLAKSERFLEVVLAMGMPEEEKRGVPAYMVSFGDMITLLLTFLFFWWPWPTPNPLV